jgi:hypothetical protein
MKQKIEAGLLANVKKTLQKLSDAFFNFIDKFNDYGVEVTNVKENKDGGTTVNCKHTESGKEFNIQTSAVDDNGNVECTVTYDGGKSKTFTVSAADAKNENLIKQIVKDLDAGNVNVKTSVKVTLQKVTGSDNLDDINLTAIDASCNITSALSLLDEVLDDDNFVAELTEEPQSFELIEPMDNLDEIQVSSIDNNFEPMYNMSYHMLYSAIQLSNNLRAICWNIKGEDFFVLHSTLDSYIWQVSSNIDILGEICIEINGVAPNPGILPEDYMYGLVDGSADFTTMEIFDYVRKSISCYIDALESGYMSFPHDIKNQLDNIIRYWKEQRDYSLKQLLYPL